MFSWFKRKEPAQEGFKGESLVVNPAPGLTPERIASIKAKVARMQQEYDRNVVAGRGSHPAVVELGKDLSLQLAILERFGAL